MSLPEMNTLIVEMPTPTVSINFAKLDDPQLAAYFQNNHRNEESFREILSRYQEHIYTYSCNVLLNKDQSSIITQEVFCKIWQNKFSDMGDMSLKTLIYRIASNEIIAFLKGQNPLLDFDDSLLHLADGLSKQGQQAQDISVKLHKALCYLPFKQKLVFVLHYFQDLSFSEIAELTQTQESILESSYQHSLKKLEIYLGVL
jgi:RNA polymerase sigma-70 factor (ECF subfamily)